MAKYQVECSVCGESFERVLFGSRKDREWKLNQPQTCTKCWCAARNAARAKANAEAKEFGKTLPALEGSEKQIAWAESLRKIGIEKAEEYAKSISDLPEVPESGYYVDLILTKLREEKDCRFWIDTRDTGAFYAIHDELINSFFKK